MPQGWGALGRWLAWGVLGLALLAVSAAPARSAETLSPQEILDRVDDLFRGQGSQGRMEMAIQTSHWSRTLALEFHTQGTDRSLFRILAPQKEKGTATLRVGPDIWNYLPKVNKVIKLPSSMMGASWMGSHFSNDDLVKESRFTQDYTFQVTFQGQRDGREVIEIDCLPQPEAPVVWGRVLVRVDAQSFLPLVISYYDEDGKLARTMGFDQVGDLGGRTLPRRLTVVPADQPDESTVVTYLEMEFDPSLPADTFSLRNLRR